MLKKICRGVVRKKNMQKSVITELFGNLHQRVTQTQIIKDLHQFSIDHHPLSLTDIKHFQQRLQFFLCSYCLSPGAANALLHLEGKLYKDRFLGKQLEALAQNFPENEVQSIEYIQYIKKELQECEKQRRREEKLMAWQSLMGFRFSHIVPKYVSLEKGCNQILPLLERFLHHKTEIHFNFKLKENSVPEQVFEIALYKKSLNLTLTHMHIAMGQLFSRHDKHLEGIGWFRSADLISVMNLQDQLMRHRPQVFFRIWRGFYKSYKKLNSSENQVLYLKRIYDYANEVRDSRRMGLLARQYGVLRWSCEQLQQLLGEKVQLLGQLLKLSSLQNEQEKEYERLKQQ